MKKFLIIIAVIAVALFAAFKFMQWNTKKSSPESTVEYKKEGKQISVFYCRPSKKGREIFGGLVPFDTVWRTGANEATTFDTSTDLMIGGKTLPAGKYTLWTIPQPEQWTVIFNSKQYGWGVNFNSQASREAEADVLQIQLPVKKLSEPLEQFTISFAGEGSNTEMVLAWDKTSVAVPLK